MAIVLIENRSNSVAAGWWAEPVCVPTWALTLDGFRRWALSEEFPQRGRISFINDEIVIDMSPEELETHNKVKSAVSYALYGWIDAKSVGDVYFDRALVTNEAAKLSTEPDCTLVLWTSIQNQRVQRKPRERQEGADAQYMEIVGSPDLVVEIVSKYSVSKDTKKLRAAYHAADVPEFWLIDAMGSEIDFQILERAPDGYIAAPAREHWISSAVLKAEVRLSRSRNPLGDWRYRLEIR